ncbi:MAG: UPF0758 domain-containing protein [Eisenbergiella sp.]
MNQKNQKEPCYEEMKPYEKFLATGPESLSEAELLAIIIRTGTRNMGSLQLANRSLPKGRDKGLLGLQHYLLGFCRVNGIGQVKAVKIKCIIDCHAGCPWRIPVTDCSLPNRKLWQTIT